MTVGLVGLGKMGCAVASKLSAAGHAVVGADEHHGDRPDAAAAGVRVVGAVGDLCAALAPPRTLWLLVPHAAVDRVLVLLRDQLSAGDTVADSGNSWFADSQRRHADLARRGIRFLDVGISGGPGGGTNGFSLVVGGEQDAVETIRPILEVLAQPAGAFGHVGPPGAGHFVKMVHNGIEYGMMESFAEGVDVLAHGPFPHLPLAEVARIWRGGSVVRSTLLDLLAEILASEDLGSVRGRVGATGEGAWMVKTAQASGLDTPAIAAAVGRRAESQRRELYAAKILALLRNRFGGHAVERT